MGEQERAYFRWGCVPVTGSSAVGGWATYRWWLPPVSVRERLPASMARHAPPSTFGEHQRDGGCRKLPSAMT